jgi:hypothetical protein
MKVLSTLLALTLAAAASASAQSSSGTATTDPVGYMTVTIPAATDPNVPTRTALCFPLHDPAGSEVTGAVVGKITAISSGTISNSSAGWTSGAFSNAASPYFVRIMTGAAKGRTLQITANTATDLTVSNQGTDLSTLGIVSDPTNGDTYQILAGDTLNTFFGTTTLSGTSDTVADNIQYWNGSAWQTFYYNSTNNRWQPRGVNISSNNFVLRPDAAIIYVRRGLTALSYTFTGTVPTTNLQYVYNNRGNTYVANGFPVDTTLATLAYNTTPAWVSGTDGNVSDQVQYWNGSAWQRFYYNSANNRWQPVGVNISSNSFTIAAGKPVMIYKTGTNAGVSSLTQQITY